MIFKAYDFGRLKLAEISFIKKIHVFLNILMVLAYLTEYNVLMRL